MGYSSILASLCSVEKFVYVPWDIINKGIFFHFGQPMSRGKICIRPLRYNKQTKDWSVLRPSQYNKQTNKEHSFYVPWLRHANVRRISTPGAKRYCAQVMRKTNEQLGKNVVGNTQSHNTHTRILLTVLQIERSQKARNTFVWHIFTGLQIPFQREEPESQKYFCMTYSYLFHCTISDSS